MLASAWMELAGMWNTHVFTVPVRACIREEWQGAI